MNALLRNRNLIPLSTLFILFRPIISPPRHSVLPFLPHLTHLCLYISSYMSVLLSLSLSLPVSLSDSVPSVWSMEFILFRKFCHDGFFLCRAVSALYFLEGLGVCVCTGGQFASVHESSEWSRGKVMFWCFSSNTRQLQTLCRIQQLRGKAVGEIFYSSARYSARGISKAALICSRACSRKIGGLVSDQTDGGEGVFAVVMHYKLGGTGQQERSGALLAPSVFAM